MKLFSKIIYAKILLFWFIYLVESAPQKNATRKDKSSSRIYTINDYTVEIEQISNTIQTDKLIDEAKAWAQNIGLLLLNEEFCDESDSIVYNPTLAPFTLFPSPLPRKCFEQAYNAQLAFNLLYFRIMCDYQFLRDVYKNLIKYDQIIKKAFDIMDQVYAEGIKQPFTILFQRSDYMISEKNEGQKQQNSDAYELKQVEVNGASIGGLGHSARMTALHQQILSKLGLDLSNSVENNTNTHTVGTLYQAWHKFGNPKAIILLISNKKYATSYEAHLLQNDMHKKFDGKVQMIVLSLLECAERITLDMNDFSLLLDDKIVAVVFNQQNMFSNDSLEMEVRRKIELSTAIKAPSIAAALAHTKKVQQVLAKPGMVERFFPKPEEAPFIKAVRDTFASFWSIDTDNDDAYADLLEKVKTNPNDFVMKKTNYAFLRSNPVRNYFGDKIAKSMADFTPEHRSAFILMEKLNPMSVKNHFVWRKDDWNASMLQKFINLLSLFSAERAIELINTESVRFFEDVTPELGIFGTLFGNIVDGEVLHNAQLGYQMKTKLASENEGGLQRGRSAFDSAYLVD